MSFASQLIQYYSNIRGWRTKRHIVVIESDDWGSIRMPSNEACSKLLSKGVQLGGYGYEKYDTIASPEDLSALFEICTSFRDIHNRPVTITANCVVANPDFEKIRNSNFEEYFYEPIIRTMDRYYPDSSPFRLWQEGIAEGVFFPQLHGREHVNVQMWMNSLLNSHPGAREAFDEGVYSIVVPETIDKRKKNTTAFRYIDTSEKQYYYQILREAQNLFEKTFGYKSLSFIAPSYSYDKDLENCLHSLGVRYMQGVHTHIEQGKRQFRYVGQVSKSGLLNLVRNAEWEPSQNLSKDNNGECLKQIATAFKWHKPATLSIHRLNFIGALDINNRDNNIKEFKALFSSIQKNWPDVEFLTSVELGNLINEECQK